MNLEIFHHISVKYSLPQIIIYNYSLDTRRKKKVFKLMTVCYGIEYHEKRFQKNKDDQQENIQSINNIG